MVKKRALVYVWASVTKKMSTNISGLRPSCEKVVQGGLLLSAQHFLFKTLLTAPGYRHKIRLICLMAAGGQVARRRSTLPRPLRCILFFPRTRP